MSSEKLLAKPFCRDDGYGSMTRKEKEKCSEPVRVEGEVRRPGSLVSVGRRGQRSRRWSRLDNVEEGRN